MMKKILLFALLLIMTTYHKVKANGAYERLSHASGIDLSVSQLQQLQDSANVLLATFPSEYQTSFKVYSFGFYLHHEVYDESYPEIFQQKKAELEAQTPYYLLFGWQTDKTGVYTKVWVDIKLPEDPAYPCLEERAWTISNVINSKIETVYPPGQVFNEYYTAELEAIKTLTQQIDHAINCCEIEGNRNPECPACFLDGNIESQLIASKFVHLKQLTNIRVVVESVVPDHEGLEYNIVADVVLADASGRVYSDIAITEQLKQAKDLLGNQVSLSTALYDVNDVGDCGTIQELYGNEIDIEGFGNDKAYTEEIIILKDGDQFSVYTRMGGNAADSFRGDEMEDRSTVILPAIILRIVIRRAVMAASNVAVNMLVEFVMERLLGDHGADCTWLETASYIEISPLRLALWAVEGALGANSAIYLALFSGLDAAFTYLFKSNDFQIEEFFQQFVVGALIGLGAHTIGGAILNSKAVKRFFQSVQSISGSTIAELENELISLIIPFLNDFRRAKAWDVFKTSPDPNISALAADVPHLERYIVALARESNETLALIYSRLVNLRPPSPNVTIGPHELELIDGSLGLQSSKNTIFNNVTLSEHGSTPLNRYLYTIDNRGVNIAWEATPYPTNRENIVHSNLSSEAYIGGEAWFGPNNSVIINAGSGRFGDGAGITESQWDAAIDFWENLGYNVTAVPYGSRQL